MKWILQFVLVLSVFGLTACDRRESTNNRQKSFTVHGTIRELTVDGRGAVIRHEEIPDFMAAMTMTFAVKDRRELSGLTPGDEVEFRLVVTDDDQWIDRSARIGHRTLPPSNKSAQDGRSLELFDGALLPDEPFLSESGMTNHFSDFRGSAVALTFLFTRCPMPTFCPLMSKHFARARGALLNRLDGPTNWQFLSLSFDPAHDSPAVLATYANAYRTGTADRWLFGVLDPTALAELSPRLNLIIQNEGGSLMHNLRTVVMDTTGHIYRQFDGNEWTPEELVDALVAAANSPLKNTPPPK